MKKQAIDTIDLKKQELQGTINDALRMLNTKLQEAVKELTNKATQEMEKIVTDLKDTVELKMNEAKSLINQQPRGTTAPAQPAQVDDNLGKNAKKKKLSPRDTEDNSDLPEFWRKNKDLGESPYLYMEELSKITDEVTQDVIKRRKKRESKKR